MDYIPLDESLIDSETCIRCGHCCKWTTTTQLGDNDRIEWVDTLMSDNPLVKAIHHNPVTYDGKKQNPFEIEIACSKLNTDDGFKKCSIYKNRPKVCSDYNCFKWSNKLKRRPQGWEKITRAIKEAHGIDVEYQNEMKPDPYKDRLANKIKTKEIF